MIEAQKAINYLRAGLSVLPANRAQKRPCLPRWSEFQARLPTEPEVCRWFANRSDAICIVCGKVSGNLEVIDFDNHGELFPKWKESIPGDLLAKLVIEQTPHTSRRQIVTEAVHTAASAIRFLKNLEDKDNE